MYKELSRKLSHDDLTFFIENELSKIDIRSVSRFIVNSDLKDFLLEYMWEVNAPDFYIKLIEDITLSSYHVKSAYELLDQDGIYYIELPSGAVVSWV